MSDTPILLASQSPRRRRLLRWLDLEFTTTSVDTPEDLDSPLASNPTALAVSLAVEKTLAALESDSARESLVMCFDTVVVHDGQVLGKPADTDDAWRMLRSLSGATHQVITGVALMCPGESEPRTFSATTVVTMKALSDSQIEEWMAQGTFMGCAGAYNIEAQVAEVTAGECFQNVAGLPLCHLHAALRELPPGCRPAHIASPVTACDGALGRHCLLGPALVDPG